ncbi:MAG: ABC transporter permease [Lachnospiraceae bacterium]|nr:ABC transporter permease [Lachnospiraceae bacterium]
MKKNRFHLTDLPSAVIIFLVVFVYFSVSANGFFSGYNFASILTQSVIPCLLVLGVAIVIMSAGLDLSVGNVLTLSGVTCGLMLKADMPVALAMLVGVLTGMTCGFLNGVMVAKMKLPPFIATLAMLNVASGLANTLSRKKPVYWTRENFPILDKIGTGTVLGIPVFAVFGVLVMAIVIFIFYRTRLRTNVYTLGGNEEVLHLSGVSVAKWKIIVFTLSGTMAGIGGVLMDARVTCADPTVGTGLEFAAVVGAVIGGNLQNTGKGNLFGAILGALTLATIRNGLSIMHMNNYWQMVLTGAILVVGMVIRELSVRIEHRRKLKEAEVAA